MMIIKILFIILLSFSFANALIINDEQNRYDFDDFKTYYDEDNKKNIDDFLENRDLFKNSNKTNIGIKKIPVWTYGKIENKTSKDLDLVFSNPRAGIDFITVFIIKDNKIFKTYDLGDMNPLENRDLIHRKSNFSLELLQNDKYEFFIKYKSFGAIDINWNIQEKKSYIKKISSESMLFGFIAGFIFLILIFVIYLDITFPKMINKVYFFLILFAILAEFSVSGILYELGLNSYFNTISSWSLGTFASALLGAFPIYFFPLSRIVPKTTIFLKVLIFSLFLLASVFLFYPINNDLLYYAPFSNLLFLITCFTLFYVSIILYKNKIDGYKFYLLGNVIFVVTGVYFVMGLLGLVPADNLFNLSIGIGLFFNILCQGLMIISLLMQINKDKENALILVSEYSKLSTIGQSMVNISHQWKEPINHIYYAVNNIIAAKEFNDPNLSNIIDNSVNQIKDTTKYMTNTAKNFLSIYEDKTIIKNIEITKSIELIIEILKKEIFEMNVKIKIISTYNYLILTNTYLVSNIFMIVLENTIKTFKSRNTKNPEINIHITEINKIFTIKISDNAGGIKEYPIYSIFEKDLTNSDSTGLGLFLAKNILNMKLNGDISVQNIKKGACFSITLKEVEV
jgi:signal transduction histidine kinase